MGHGEFVDLRFTMIKWGTGVRRSICLKEL